MLTRAHWPCSKGLLLEVWYQPHLGARNIGSAPTWTISICSSTRSHIKIWEVLLQTQLCSVVSLTLLFGRQPHMVSFPLSALCFFSSVLLDKLLFILQNPLQRALPQDSFPTSPNRVPLLSAFSQCLSSVGVLLSFSFLLVTEPLIVTTWNKDCIFQTSLQLMCGHINFWLTRKQKYCGKSSKKPP